MTSDHQVRAVGVTSYVDEVVARGEVHELTGAGAACHRWETCGGSTKHEVVRGTDEGTSARVGVSCCRW
jgi:heme A synthase